MDDQTNWIWRSEREIIIKIVIYIDYVFKLDPVDTYMSKDIYKGSHNAILKEEDKSP